MKKSLFFITFLSLFAITGCDVGETNTDNTNTDNTPQHVHSFGDPTYSWLDDNSKCTARRVCSQDETHVETETVNSVYSVIRAATETQDGEGKYVATFTNSAFAQQTKTIVLPSPGSLSKLTFTLLDDNTFSVKAKSTSISGAINIPAIYEGRPVSTIPSQGFNGCSSVTSIYIPEGVSKIEDYAFWNCTSLISVSVPETIRRIGWNIFEGCSNVSYTTYANAKYIGNTTNPYTVLISSINPDATTGTIHPYTILVGYRAFYQNQYIQSLSIPNGVKSLCDNCFFGLSLITSVVVPDSVEFFGQSVFNSCSALESVVLSKNLTQIGNSAFAWCFALTSIVVPENVKRIDDGAFWRCTALERVYLPDGLEYVGGEIFLDCTSLQHTVYDHCAYVGNTNNPYLVLHSSSTSVTSVSIHDGCKVISKTAFSQRSNLTSVTIPNSVKYICERAFEKTPLTDITIPSSVIRLDSAIFSGCTKLTSATLSNNITSISASLFKNCTKLNNFVIGINIKSIGAYAFDTCTSLNDFSYEGTINEFKALPKGTKWADLIGTSYIQCSDGTTHV